jgi:ATP-dependent RNA helicase DDX24/MAK5
MQGSGKTLAYGLPILHKLTKKREQEKRDGVEKDSRLKALLLAPTRELAVQVSDQLKLIAKHTPITVVPVIGGLAPQKQVRLLSKRPEVVVATPGRLWELINGVRQSHRALHAHPARTLTHAFVDVVVMGVQGDPFLSDCTGLEFLVIDEADRMVETGHFLELKSILTLIQHPASRELIVLPSTSVRCHSV